MNQVHVLNKSSTFTVPNIESCICFIIQTDTSPNIVISGHIMSSIYDNNKLEMKKILDFINKNTQNKITKIDIFGGKNKETQIDFKNKMNFTDAQTHLHENIVSEKLPNDNNSFFHIKYEKNNITHQISTPILDNVNVDPYLDNKIVRLIDNAKTKQPLQQKPNNTCNFI